MSKERKPNKVEVGTESEVAELYPYECCGEGFKNIAQFYEHQRRHHDSDGFSEIGLPK